MFGRVVSAPALRRGFQTTTRKRSGFNPDDEMRPISNMPFNVGSPLVFTIGFGVFCSSGFSVPFLLVRHNLKNK